MKRKAQIHRHAWLHEERTRRRWSQQQLADKLGTTAVTISRWENVADHAKKN